MNQTHDIQPRGSRWITPIGVIGALLTMAILVAIMVQYTRPENLNAKRAAERAKALAEMNAQNQEALSTYGWLDQPKGLVRLPISRAMELTVNNWLSPATGRSNLMERVEKATVVPPPPPNPFE
jgi:hypothetical protein